MKTTGSRATGESSPRPRFRHAVVIRRKATVYEATSIEVVSPVSSSNRCHCSMRGGALLRSASASSPKAPSASNQHTASGRDAVALVRVASDPLNLSPPGHLEMTGTGVSSSIHSIAAHSPDIPGWDPDPVRLQESMTGQAVDCRAMEIFWRRTLPNLIPCRRNGPRPTAHKQTPPRRGLNTPVCSAG